MGFDGRGQRDTDGALPSNDSGGYMQQGDLISLLQKLSGIQRQRRIHTQTDTRAEKDTQTER
jgi:hypothetical protein